MTSKILEVALPVPIHKTFDYLPPASFCEFNVQDVVGHRVLVPFGFKNATGIVCGVKNFIGYTSPRQVSGRGPGFEIEKKSFKLKSVIEFLDEEPVLEAPMIIFGSWLARRYACSLGEAIFSLFPPEVKFKTSKEIVPETLSFSSPSVHSVDILDSIPSFSNEITQQIEQALYSMRQKTFVLLDGSLNKTQEVIYSSIKKALGLEKNVLYLCPEVKSVEIAFSSLKAHFENADICAWHGEKSSKERFEDWWRVRRSEVSIVVGTRSAALAPLQNIGLIIVEDEPNAAYKEERKPRFHARDVILYRAQEEKAVVVLMGDTPSIETCFQIQENNFSALNLGSENKNQASVQLVDLTKEKSKKNISLPLEKALSQCLQQKNKAILFLNRRGFYRSFRCFDCSWVAHCPQCRVVLTFERKPRTEEPRPQRSKKGRVQIKGTLSCQQCGKVCPAPIQCERCQKQRVGPSGVGTQRVVEEVQEKFPWARILRLDRDVISKSFAQKNLEKIKNGEFDILVGTQMVLENLNMPQVNLLGVVNADLSLQLPDFRSAERTFRLLRNLVLSSGRNMASADIILQTRHPEHYVLKCLIEPRKFDFWTEELGFRKELNYPPFSHLVLVRAEDRQDLKVQKAIDDFCDWLKNFDPENQVGILGPMDGTRKGKTQKKAKQLLLKIPLHVFDSFLTNLELFLSLSSTRLWVDVDPENFS